MKVLTLFVLFFSFALVRAQGNLQFSAVKFVTLDVPAGNATCSPTTHCKVQVGSVSFVVPAGKVWKVKGIYAANNNISIFGAFVRIVNSSGFIIYENSIYDRTDGNKSTDIEFWLPAGTYSFREFITTSGPLNTPTPYPNNHLSLNALEFNVIP